MPPDTESRSLPSLLIPLTAFLAVLPLLLRGPSCGHDFDFHLLSWLEAATQYAHGAYPHWAYTPAYNAGEPRFLFYPPLSWTLGAILTLVLPVQFAGTAFTFLALTLSGFTAHSLARRYAPPAVATLCAVLYLANPYMLFTAYERSAFAELLAAAWLPLLFRAALSNGKPYDGRDLDPASNLKRPTPRSDLRSPLPGPGYPTQTTSSSRSRSGSSLPPRSRQILRIAVPITLLWLTNAPAAVMGCYALAVLTLTRLLLPPTSWQPRKTVLAFTTLAGTILGLLLPAFYLLPAAWERRYVQISMATMTGMRPQDHFLFHHMPGLTPDDLFHNAVVRTASQVSLLLLVAIATISLSGWLNSRSATKPAPARRDTGTAISAAPTHQATLLILLPLTLLVAFLLTPPSLPLWLHTPQLAFLQFPWRLNALLAVVLLTVAATVLRRLAPPLWLPLAAAAALIFPAYSLFHQPCDSTDTPTARAQLFHSPLGTEPTDEYTPAAADNDQLHPGTAAWTAACSANLPLDPEKQRTPPYLPQPAPGVAPSTLDLNLPCPASLIFNRRQFPVWQVTDNGQPLTPPSPGEDGLLTLNLPAGPHHLRLLYRRTPDQNLGLVLSALAAIVAVLLWRLHPTNAFPPRKT